MFFANLDGCFSLKIRMGRVILALQELEEAMSQQLKDRTKTFADAVVKFGFSLPDNATTDVIWRQVLRSSLSIGANYRSACCARSRGEFIAKLHIAREEADESQYWFERLQQSVCTNGQSLEPLLQEARELTAILTVSLVTAKRNARSKRD
jgi:four helix bundle protein